MIVIAFLCAGKYIINRLHCGAGSLRWHLLLVKLGGGDIMRHLQLVVSSFVAGPDVKVAEAFKCLL